MPGLFFYACWNFDYHVQCRRHPANRCLQRRRRERIWVLAKVCIMLLVFSPKNFGEYDRQKLCCQVKNKILVWA
jgi:hypothetical protein